MAARTPGLQARSGFHAYWGQYNFDGAGTPNTYGPLGRSADVGANSLPNAVNNALPLAEFSKLEAGDTASTIVSPFSPGAATFLFGLWTCISPGTVGAGDAVWVRLDNQSSTLVQTIRDAHRIVVGITGTRSAAPPNTSDTLLNLDPYTAGVSADFIDTGDGNEFESAMIVASAISTFVGSRPIDIRVVSGQINFGAGVASLPINIPASCRLIGAGKTLTEFVGRNSLGESQKVFTLGLDASIEDLYITSKAPAGAPPAGSAGGVISASGNFSAKNVSVRMADDALRLTRFGFHGVSATGLSTVTLSNVSVIIESSTTLGTVGIRLDDYTRSSISDVKVDGAEYGVAFAALTGGASGGTARGNSVTRFTGTGIQTAAFFVGAEQDVSTSHLTFSDSSVTFEQAVGTEQYLIQTTATNNNAVNQLHVSGCHTEFGFQGLNATFRALARLRVTGSARILGASFSGCGIVSDAVGSIYGSPTQGIILDNASSAPNAIRGGDLLCDIAGVGPLPISGADIINYVGLGSTLWEHAHPSGLA